MAGLASKIFIVISVVGIGEAFYHAWLEKAFTTNIFAIHYSEFASIFGIPYWLFGIVWFPLILVVGLWATGIGRKRLNLKLLALLTVGNVFTGYLWYLDIEVVKSIHLLYIALYATNYALTGIVVAQNWATSDIVHGYVYGTATGAVIGLLFGPYGVAACGIAGGMFGAIRNRVLPKEPTEPVQPEREGRKYLEEEKAELEKRLRDIEERLSQQAT